MVKTKAGAFTIRQTARVLHLFIRSNLYYCSGNWIWDLPGDEILCSDVMPLFQGLETNLYAKTLIHPDDLPIVLELLEQVRGAQEIQATFRVITTMGEVRTVRGAGRFEYESKPDYTDRLSLQLVQQWEAEKGMQIRLDALDIQHRVAENAELANDAGTWYYNVITGQTWYSDQYFRIFHLRPQTLNHHLHTFHPFIHEEDREAVIEVQARSVAEQIPINIEYRIVCNDLALCHVRETTRVVLSARGETIICGNLQNITEAREIEKTLEASEQALSIERNKLRTIERLSQSGTFEVNASTRKAQFSDGMYYLLGLKPGAKPPGLQTLIDSLDTENLESVSAVLLNDLEVGEFTPYDFYIIRPDGKRRHIRRMGRVVKNQQGDSIMLGVLHDVTNEDELTVEVAMLETRLSLLEETMEVTETAVDSGHWLWDLSGKRVRWSDNLFRMLGYKIRLTTFTTDQFINHLHASDRAAFATALAGFLEEKKETTFCFRYLRRNETRSARAHFRIHTSGEGQYFAAVFTDITELRSLEQSLQEQMNFNEAASDNTVDHILITDVNHNITLWNRQLENTYGWKRDKVLGRNFFDVFPEMNREDMRLNLQTAFRGEPVYLKDQKLVGTKNIVTITLSPIRSYDGSVKGVLHVLHDNTREHALREELTQRLNFIEKLLEASIDRIIVLDRHMNYVYWNKRAEKYYGLHKEDVTGRNILELYPSLANDPSYVEFRKCLRGETIHIPATRDPDEKKGYFETFLIPLKDDQRNVTGVLWIVHDLAGEYRLAKQQRKARHVLELINEAYVELDLDNCVQFINQQAEELWGISSDEAIDRSIFEIVPANDGSEIVPALKRALRERNDLRGEYFLPGVSRWIYLSCTVTEDGALIFFYDITVAKKASEELNESRLFIEQVTTTIPDFITIEDIANDRIRYVNESALSGRTLPANGVASGIRAETSDILHPDDRERVLDWIDQKKNMRENDIWELEYRLANNKWVRSKSKVFRTDDEGRPTQILSITNDITQRKRAELEIRESKELLQGIIDAPNIGIAVYKALRDREGRIIDFVHEFINRRMIEVLGSDITGRLLSEVEPQGRQFERFSEVLQTGRSNSYAIDTQLDDGWRWVLFSNAPIDGDRLVHVWEDVTELKLAEKEVEKQSTLLKQTEESAQSGSWDYDIASDRLTWSEGMYKLLGIPRRMYVRPETYLDVVVEEDRPAAKRIINYLRKRQQDFEVSIRVQTPGGVRLLKVMASVKTDEEGQPVTIVGTDLDITDFNEIEAKLRESRHWLEQTALASPDSISVYDLQKKQPYYLNDRLSQWLGIPPERLLEMGIEGRLQHFYPDDRLRILHFNERIAAASDTDILTLEYRVLTVDGRTLWLQNRSKILQRDADGRVRHVLTQLQDVTESVQMREELKRRTQYAESIIDASIDRIAVYDHDLRVIAWNRRSEEITGHKKEQVIGQKIFDIFPGILLDEELLKAHLDAVEGQYVKVPVRRGLYTNNLYERFYIPLKNEQGEVYAIVNIMHDLSELASRNTELIDLNKTLDQRNRELEQKNEEITHFSFVASHDMKEPLRKIHTFSDWLLFHEQDNLSPEGKKFVTRMSAAVKRMELLIEDILVLTKIHSDRYKEEDVDLEKVLAQVLEDMGEEIGNREATIEAGGLPVVSGNANQLFYLFKNLISNGIKFQRPGNLPKIAISYKVVDSRDVPRIAQPQDEYIQLSFTDNGFGFDRRYSKKIFQVFQRLHAHHEYEGTGIGLAICKQIMENHEGAITVESEPDKGSVFHCFFPVK